MLRADNFIRHAAQPAQRVYNFRGDFKWKLVSMIQLKYECADLGDVAATRDGIQWLKRELMYIYPCSATVRMTC